MAVLWKRIGVAAVMAMGAMGAATARADDLLDTIKQTRALSVGTSDDAPCPTSTPKRTRAQGCSSTC